jgi:putative DNA modification/repair radical SAM protein
VELKRKLSILADAAKYDASCASSGSKRAAVQGGVGSTEGMGICHSYTPDGRCVSLLKILLTNSCVYDCQYCVNRVSSDVPRARFTPREVVQLTLDFYRRNYIEGLFLSSGIPRSPDATVEELVEVARSLRQEHGFGGYIHLKVVPGASAELLAEAGRWADRLSANVELPTASDLARLAPQKTMSEVEGAMSSIAARIEEHPRSFARAGQSTQMVIGATPASDAEILATANSLYARHRLRRVYYTAYSPIQSADPRLPARAPPLAREHRLYQADWLVRFYGFRSDELTVAAEPNLPLDLDPKLAWALRNRAFFPVDVNRAAREVLLRVPGFGTKTVRTLLQARRHRAVRLDDLRRLGVPVRRAAEFVITADHRPSGTDRLDLAPRLKREKPQQLALFASAVTGQL